MSEPLSMIVPLPSPAGADVQALAACEFILDAQGEVATRLSGQSSSEFKCRVVAWLAEKYLKQQVSIGSSLSVSDCMPLPMCSKVDCMRTGWLPCNSNDCPKRAR